MDLLRWVAIISFCFNVAYAQEPINRELLTKVVDDGLLYLAQVQEKETIGDSIYKGEWPSTMGLKNGYVLLGKSYEYRDSNCFTQAAIFNILSELYLEDTSRVSILPMLEVSLPQVLSYRTGETFNFWKLLEPNRDLSKREPNPVGYKVHRPTNYKLNTRFINNAANVANDADDTASGNLAIFNYLRMHGNMNAEFEVMPASASVFNKYLDKKRNNYHWYNFIHKIPRPSHAYMTWLSDEFQFKNWGFLKQVVHNCFFYARWSSCYPHPFQRYVPWGANDVDAVVNANVVHYLGETGQLQDAAGLIGAIDLFKNAVKRDRWSRAGIYYPNRYYFHYMYAKSLAYVGDSLQNETAKVIAHLINSQKNDGCFHSRYKVNKRDIVQSTVYAFNALVELKSQGYNVPQDSIDAALNFLLNTKRNDGSWKGGVFFSGGTVVRNTLYFKSDAFTTALVIRGVSKYLNLQF